MIKMNGCVCSLMAGNIFGSVTSEAFLNTHRKNSFL